MCKNPTSSTVVSSHNTMLNNNVEQLKVELNRVELNKRESVKVELPQSSSVSSLESIESKTEYVEKPRNRSIGRKRSLPVNEDTLISLLGESISAIASKGRKTCTSYTGKATPKISLVDYLRRMVRYLNEWQPRADSEGCSLGTRVVVMSMIYIDRLCQKDPNFCLTVDNVHRVCMTAILVATKFLEDEVFPNHFWAKVAGVSLSELNRLETKFCCQINFDLWVKEEEFKATFNTFSRHSHALSA